MSSYVYGIVLNDFFYSNRMEFKINGLANGIYGMDMEQDDFKSSAFVADIEDARKFFKKSSKIELLKGISIHDGFIPENPVKHKRIPIKVSDATYDDLEEIEVAIIKGKIYYYIQTLFSDKSYVLMDVKNCLDDNKSIRELKGLTPEIRITYTFINMERQKEKLKKELMEPKNAIRKMIAESGATLDFVKKNNRGFEVQWKLDEYTINTQIDNNYRVIEAGFCVSNWDGTQSIRSLPNVLNDYCSDGYSYVNITRSAK